ncbi:hypothetical protein O9929_13695 [Vibrio lentus]|nr:hypothetical protein [Vibrio lentus]
MRIALQATTMIAAQAQFSKKLVLNGEPVEHLTLRLISQSRWVSVDDTTKLRNSTISTGDHTLAFNSVSHVIRLQYFFQ